MQISHKTIQHALKNTLTQEEVWLEHPFPEIQRIADVVWPAKKWIFEVQCSAITPFEMAARMRDYRSIGYTVIWIFHDHRFNQKTLSSAERYVQKAPHLFSDSQGSLYTQRARILFGKRLRRAPRCPIDITAYTPPKQKRRQLPFCRVYHAFFVQLLEKFCD